MGSGGRLKKESPASVGVLRQNRLPRRRGFSIRARRDQPKGIRSGLRQGNPDRLIRNWNSNNSAQAWGRRTEVGDINCAVRTDGHGGWNYEPGQYLLHMARRADANKFAEAGRWKSWGIGELEDVEAVAIVKSKSKHGGQAGGPRFEIAARRELEDVGATGINGERREVAEEQIAVVGDPRGADPIC